VVCKQGVLARKVERRLRAMVESLPGAGLAPEEEQV
jgi:hypothetical protein